MKYINLKPLHNLRNKYFAVITHGQAVYLFNVTVVTGNAASVTVALDQMHNGDKHISHTRSHTQPLKQDFTIKQRRAKLSVKGKSSYGPQRV